MIGKTLGHYEITEKIGAGGMGEVYRGIDTKLGREVALKVLPPTFTENAERMARFEREARVLASLNHPGIASIYALEEQDGVRFLALELAEGEDLAERIARGPLPLDVAIGLAVQIVEALEAAHAQGIVHRDLKPANIKVSSQGQVKVLDFGLAKVLGDDPRSAEIFADSPTTPPGVTRTGVILGTAAYMSPEQARGMVTDTRCDIWAFGCVLWECLTGGKVFGGETTLDTIGAILHAEPDWKLLPAHTPGRVRRVLRRCLVKDPRHRLHHIADVRIELEDAETGEPRILPPAPVSREWNRQSLILALSALLVATLGALVAQRFGWIGIADSPAVLENPLATAEFSKLTDFPRDEFDAALSRDGRFVTFVSNRDGPFEIFVGQTDSREFWNLSQGREGEDYAIAVFRSAVHTTGFTWDGSRVWFGGTGLRIRTASIMGGPVNHFLNPEAVEVSWSPPDGERIVYHLSTSGDPVYVADRDGANSVLVLASAEGHHQHYPTWSPDGSWIYLVRGRPATGEMDLWRMRPDGSRLERLTEELKNVSSPTFLDDRTVLFCAEESDGAGPWLWAMDVETRVPRRISIGLAQYSSISASADGRRLVVTEESPQAELWSVPILERAATESDATLFELPSIRARAPRLGSGQLFYLSSRGTGDGLWRYQDGKSSEIWSGAEIALLEPAAISPDGKELALILRKDAGGPRLYVLSSDGAELRALTAEVEVRGSVSWSPDGRWLVAGGRRSSALGLFKIPTDGGPPELILDGEARSPVWSPSGDLIVYEGGLVEGLSPLRGVDPDGNPVELPEIQLLRGEVGHRARFLHSGKGLVYMQGISHSQDFWLLDLTSMKTRSLTKLEDPAEMQTFDVTPDDAGILFDRLRRNSDLVLIELEGKTRSN